LQAVDKIAANRGQDYSTPDVLGVPTSFHPSTQHGIHLAGLKPAVFTQSELPDAILADHNAPAEILAAFEEDLFIVLLPHTVTTGSATNQLLCL